MSSDFLKQMREAGEEYSSGDSQGVIGQIKVEFGLHRYVNGHDFWTFWKPVGSKADIERVEAELKGRLQEAGSTESPNFGIRVTIKKEVLSRDTPYERDLSEFTAAWQKDGYSLIMDNLEQGQLPAGEWFYGRVRYIANPFFVKQGEKGKKDTDQDGNPRFPSVRVPVEKFADESAARAAVPASESTGNTHQWSERLRNGHMWTETFLDDNGDEIRQMFEQVKNTGKKPYDGAPDFSGPATDKRIKEYMAGDDLYHCEVADINIALDSVPF
jgi:hypothetical protein